MDETSNAYNDINSYNEVLQGSSHVKNLFTKKERIGETILAVGAPITLKITEKALSRVAKKYSKPSVAADEPAEEEGGGWEFQNPAFEGHLRQWNQDDGMEMDELYPVRGEAIDGIPSQPQGYQEARAFRGDEDAGEEAGADAGEEAGEAAGEGLGEELAEDAVVSSVLGPEATAAVAVAALGVTLYEGFKDIFDTPKAPKKPRAIVSMAQQGV